MTIRDNVVLLRSLSSGKNLMVGVGRTGPGFWIFTTPAPPDPDEFPNGTIAHGFYLTENALETSAFEIIHTFERGLIVKDLQVPAIFSRRQNARYLCNFRFQFSSPEASGPGICVNISIGGMSGLIERGIEIPSQLDVKLLLPDDFDPIVTRGQTQYHSSDGDDSGPLHEIRIIFNKLDRIEHHQLVLFLNYLKTEGATDLSMSDRGIQITSAVKRAEEPNKDRSHHR
ncbi:MAG: PilZ domain-containing protein, partial [Armatimonadetes bacterium]|nr:PilZ domain-containing protein [Armatimonadota bacterium]